MRAPARAAPYRCVSGRESRRRPRGLDPPRYPGGSEPPRRTSPDPSKSCACALVAAPVWGKWCRMENLALRPASGAAASGQSGLGRHRNRPDGPDFRLVAPFIPYHACGRAEWRPSRPSRWRRRVQWCGAVAAVTGRLAPHYTQYAHPRPPPDPPGRSRCSLAATSALGGAHTVGAAERDLCVGGGCPSAVRPAGGGGAPSLPLPKVRSRRTTPDARPRD